MIRSFSGVLDRIVLALAVIALVPVTYSIVQSTPWA